MSWATSLWYWSSPNTQKEQMQSSANTTTFEKNWKIYSFFIPSSQKAVRDPKLTEWSQDVWHKLPYKALCPLNAHEQLCQKTIPMQFLYDRTVKSWGHFSSRGCSSFTLHLSTPFFPSPGVGVPKSVFTLKNYLVPMGRVDPWTLQDFKRTFLALHSSSEGWLESYQIYRKGLQKW